MSKYNSGVYRIEIGDKYYFGLSSNLTDRKSKHLSDLRFGRHKNPYMQAAYNKHGEYSFKTLAYCEGDYMSRLEASLIQQHYDDDRCMNLIAEEGCGGSKHSEESRRKISESKLGKPRSEETRRKLSESHRGKVMSDEARMRMSMAQRGRRHKPDTIQKIREAATSRKLCVVMRGPDGQEFYFASVKTAAKYFGMNRSYLGQMLRGDCRWQSRRGATIAGWNGQYIDKEVVSGN